MGLIMKAGCIKPKMPLWPFKATEKLPPRNHQRCVPFSPVLKQRMGILLLAFPLDDFLWIGFMTFQLLSLKSSALAALWGSAVRLEIGKCLYFWYFLSQMGSQNPWGWMMVSFLTSILLRSNYCSCSENWKNSGQRISLQLPFLLLVKLGGNSFRIRVATCLCTFAHAGTCGCMPLCWILHLK